MEYNRRFRYLERVQDMAPVHVNVDLEQVDPENLASPITLEIGIVSAQQYDAVVSDPTAVAATENQAEAAVIAQQIDQQPMQEMPMAPDGSAATEGIWPDAHAQTQPDPRATEDNAFRLFGMTIHDAPAPLYTHYPSGPDRSKVQIQLRFSSSATIPVVADWCCVYVD